LQMLKAAPQLGFKLGTLADVSGQLVSERLNASKRSRRRTYQAVLAFDIFLKQLAATQPDFATFFTNHVASSMHRFWAARFPDDYTHFEYDPEWVNTYCREIEFAMSKADLFLGRLLRFVDRHPQYTLWVATSMGQQASEAVRIDTQLYCTDLKMFLAALGILDAEWKSKPAMLPQCNFEVRSDLITEVRDSLTKLIIADKPITFRESGNLFSIDFGHGNVSDDATRVRLRQQSMSLAELGLKNVAIDEKSGANAYHIPQGCLLIYDPARRPSGLASAQVSTLDLAPTILHSFGIEIPSYMKRPASLGPFGAL